MKILSSLILSFILIGLWSCSDGGKDPVSSVTESECTQNLDCNGVCGGSAIEDCAGDCDGNAITDECGECNGEMFLNNNAVYPNELCDCGQR